jgi:hypothetical protein
MPYVSTNVALASAIIAFEQNGNKVERDHIAAVGDLPAIEPNRVIMRKLLQKENAISNEDLQRGAELENFLKQVLSMQLLTRGSGDKFLYSIIDSFSSGNVNLKNVGLLAWAPKLAKDFKRKNDINEVIATFQYTSNYIGTLGSTVEFHFTQISQRLMPKLMMYVVMGHDNNGNLVSYLTKENKIVKDGYIRGRIKEHVLDYHSYNAKVTVLHYVKAVK